MRLAGQRYLNDCPETVQIQPNQRRYELGFEARLQRDRVEQRFAATGSGILNRHHVAPAHLPVAEDQADLENGSWCPDVGEARSDRLGGVEEAIPSGPVSYRSLVVVVERALAVREDDVADAHGPRPRPSSCRPWSRRPQARRSPAA